MEDQIICPQCSANIPLTKSLTDPIVRKYKQEIDREASKKSRALEALEKSLKEKEWSIDSQVEEKLKLEKIKIWKTAEEKAKENVGIEVQDLKNQTGEMALKLKTAQEQELKFLKEKRDLEERTNNIELEYQKNWAKREKQMQRVIETTFGMHGDLAGLMGASLPEIKMMELTEGADEEETAT